MTKRDKLKLMPAHAEGSGARIKGLAIEANPYEKGTDDYLAWNAGWSRADWNIKVFDKAAKDDGAEKAN